MRVRHKQTGYEFEVQASRGCHWVLGDSLLAKHEWELIDQRFETWRDVTTELEVCPDGRGIVEKGSVAMACQDLWEGYRLRKVQLFETTKGFADYPAKWAFIIERKEPHE